MRVGNNPQKSNITELRHKTHRVILPFWIPNVSDDYFKEQPQVLYWCLKSLTSTINPEKTNITLINNSSCAEASEIAEQFVKQGLIDKYVVRNENRGKLEVVLAEARASFEDYITIADADFLFFQGWEEAVIEIFEASKRAGVVSCYPCPNLATYYNSAWLWNAKIKSGKVIPDSELDLVELGLGNIVGKGIFSGIGVKRKSTWRENQYYIKNKSVTACMGATHALATFKRDIIQKLPFKKVEFVFKNGYEYNYIDFIVEQLGYYRLSTVKCHAYHMGNTLPLDMIQAHKTGVVTQKEFPKYKSRNVFFNKLVYLPTSFIMGIIRKYGLL